MDRATDVQADIRNTSGSLIDPATEQKQDDAITEIIKNQSQKDIFDNKIVITPYNQIELRLDSADYLDFIDTTVANGGTVTQSGGELLLQTSTATNGSAIVTSKDTLEYRPGFMIIGGGTARFTTGVTGSIQRVGISDDISFTNSVTFDYEEGTFGIRYTRGGVQVSFTPQASWTDPCLGAAGSKFTRSGTPEALDPTKGNLYRVQCALFGYAGWKAEVWSPDNGWITVYQSHNINSDTPVFTSNSFKVILYNTKTSGATNITMRSQCWQGGTGSDLERAASTVTDRTLVKNNRSIITGKRADGAYANVNITNGNNLKISLEEFENGFYTTPLPVLDYKLAVSKGLITGIGNVHKFGRNSAVGTSPVPVCDGGFFQTPTAVVTLEAISTSVNDTAGGTGAQEITLEYLDANFVSQTATIAMNGTTATTATVAGVLRLNRAYVSNSGTYATQALASQNGTITIRVAGAGATWAVIPTIAANFGAGQSLIGAYCVPAGKTAYILGATMTVDANQPANLFFFKRENANDVTTPYSGVLRVQNIYTGVSGVHEINHKTHEMFPEKTDIGFLAVAQAGTADVSVEFEIELVTN